MSGDFLRMPVSFLKTSSAFLQMPALEGLRFINILETSVKKLKMPINECSKSTNNCLMPALEGSRFIKILETSVKKLKKPTD